MDLKLFLSTFFLIFLAELGDKTQLTALILSAKSKNPTTIFFASILGFALATLIAVLIGTVGAKFIPQFLIKKISAILFILIGILILLNRI